MPGIVMERRCPYQSAVATGNFRQIRAGRYEDIPRLLEVLALCRCGTQASIRKEIRRCMVQLIDDEVALLLIQSELRSTPATTKVLHLYTRCYGMVQSGVQFASPWVSPDVGMEGVTPLHGDGIIFDRPKAFGEWELQRDADAHRKERG